MSKEWKTKNGRKIRVCDMETSHIENSLSMLKREGCIDPETLSFYLSCRPPTADGALMAFEREFDRVISAPISSFINLFKEELERRRK